MLTSASPTVCPSQPITCNNTAQLSAGSLPLPQTRDRHPRASVSSNHQPQAPPPTANADKIKAEHMRSSSAMPALTSLHLKDKPSLLSRSNTVAGTESASAAAAASMQQSHTTSGPNSDQSNPVAKATAGILGHAHTVAAMDQTKLQAPVSSEAAEGAVQGRSTAWKKQRPGATFFEKLQVSPLCDIGCWLV